MNVDYFAISEADPGGSVDAAYAALGAITTVQPTGVSYTSLQLVEALGYPAVARLETALAGAATLPPSLLTSLGTTGLDFATAGIIAALSDTSLPAADVTALTALCQENVRTFNNLRKGYIERARELYP